MMNDLVACAEGSHLLMYFFYLLQYCKIYEPHFPHFLKITLDIKSQYSLSKCKALMESDTSAKEAACKFQLMCY